MKNFIFLFISSLIALAVKAQTIVGKSYVTNVENIKVYPVDDSINKGGRFFYYVHRNTKFTVIGIDDKNNVIVTFWEYKGHAQDKNPDKNKMPQPNKLPNGVKEFASVDEMKIFSVHGPNIETGSGGKAGKFEDYFFDEEYIGAWAGNRSFIMPLASVNQLTQQYYGKSYGFTWGVMTLPVKLRFGNKGDRFFNLEEKINLGFSAGIRKQIPSRINQAYNFIGGFGVSSVKTDSVSLKPGFYDSKHLSEVAFSFNIGVLYQYESFQVGIFLGKDYIASALSREWKYQGKTWLGLAIGVSLFSKPAAEATPGKN